MVKELVSRNTSKKPASRSFRGAQQTTILLHLFGLGMVTQYAWENGGLQGFSDAFREFNRVLDMKSIAGFSTTTLEEDMNSTTTSAAIQQQAQKPIPVEEMSVFEYHVCCGLGHRMSRMGAIYHAAHQLGYKLNMIWHNCGTNLFDVLFAPETQEDLNYVNRTNEIFYLNNDDIPTFINANRWLNRRSDQEELDSYYNMHESLLKRYKFMDEIDEFMQKNFQGKLVIGLHIRAGNGEQGDFAIKKRSMALTAQNYTSRATQYIQRMVKKANSTLPPVLFLATDTAEYVPLFRTALEGVMDVLEWSQEREAPGEGVFMGQFQKRIEEDKCIRKWKDMIADNILLSFADLMIAGQYSSFNQGMPLFLTLGRKNRKFEKPFCEFYKEALEIKCFSDPMDWNMNSQNVHTLKTRISKESNWPEKFLKAMEGSRKYYKDRNQVPVRGGENLFPFSWT